MKRRLLSTYRCPLCLKHTRLIGQLRRAHPPLCWHKHTEKWGAAPKTTRLEGAK